jgi:hypothetical protein
MMAVDRWTPYLQRSQFVIKTDHQSLTFLGEQQLQSEWQKKAMAKLMGLQFQIVYKKGKENVVADALSRVGMAMAISTVTELQPVWIQEVTNSYVTDLQAQQLLQKLAVHSPDEAGFSLHQGVIRKQQQIWIGQNSALRTKVISAFHDSVVGGHSGITATYQRVKRMFWWQGLKTDVESFVKQCSVCQQAKSEKQLPTGLLQPLPVPTGAWKDITMDFIEKLPKSEGYDTILVVVDRFSKYAHFLPLRHPFSAQMVAQVILDNVVKLHGVPNSVVSDRDKVFTSAFWRHLFDMLKIKLALSTAYHPQTDGQSERVNQCLEMYLRCAVHATPHKWKSWLAMAEFWYNTTYHSSLGCSPFKALYGYEASVLAAPDFLGTEDTEAGQWVNQRDAYNVMLKEQLLKAQQRAKHFADLKRRPREFQVGEQVLLKLQPYAQY